MKTAIDAILAASPAAGSSLSEVAGKMPGAYGRIDRLSGTRSFLETNRHKQLFDKNTALLCPD
jgi:hypothetical protein